MKAVLLRLTHRTVEVLAGGAIAGGLLLFGGTVGWGLTLAFGLMGAAFCLWFALRLWVNPEAGISQPSPLQNGPNSAPFHVASRWLPWMILWFGIALILQLLPLPEVCVAWLSPVRVGLARLIREGLGEPGTGWLTLSLAPESSRRSMILFALGLMAFAVGGGLGANPARARRIVLLLIWLVLLEALYGLAENLSGHHHTLWVARQVKVTASGSLINRDHFSAILALFLPISIGWFYYGLAVRHGDANGRLPVKLLIGDIFSDRHGLWILVPAVLLLGIIQGASRGACLTAVLDVTLLTVLGCSRRHPKAAAGMAVIIAAVCIAFAALGNISLLMGRFDSPDFLLGGGRLRIWRNCLGIVRDFPLFGVGTGNFPAIYMHYSLSDTSLYPYEAHNEWLEALICLGIFGAAPLMVGVFAIFAAAYRKVRWAGPDRPWLLGCWCGLIGFCAHCCTEYLLHISAIVLLVGLLAGLLAGFGGQDPPGQKNRPNSDGG